METVFLVIEEDVEYAPDGSKGGRDVYSDKYVVGVYRERDLAMRYILEKNVYQVSDNCWTKIEIALDQLDEINYSLSQQKILGIEDF